MPTSAPKNPSPTTAPKVVEQQAIVPAVCEVSLCCSKSPRETLRGRVSRADPPIGTGAFSHERTPRSSFQAALVLRSRALTHALTRPTRLLDLNRIMAVNSWVNWSYFYSPRGMALSSVIPYVPGSIERWYLPDPNFVSLMNLYDKGIWCPVTSDVFCPMRQQRDDTIKGTKAFAKSR